MIARKFIRQELRHDNGCTQVAIASLLGLTVDEVCKAVPIRKLGTSTIAFKPILKQHGYTFALSPIIASVRYSGRRTRHCVLIDELDIVYDGHLDKPVKLLDYLKNPTGSGRRRYIESLSPLSKARSKKELKEIADVYEKQYQVQIKKMKEQDKEGQ